MDEEDFLADREVVEVEEVLDPSKPEDAFKIVSRSYHKLIEELEHQQVEEKYLDDIEKMFEYLCGMRDQVLSLTTERDAIAKDLNEDRKFVRETEAVSALQREQIQRLEAEVESSHQCLDNAYAREQSCTEVIDNLRRSTVELRDEIEYRAKIAERPLTFGTTVSGGVGHDKDVLATEFSKLTIKFQNAMTYQESLEREKITFASRIQELQDQAEENEVSSLKHQRRSEILQRKLMDLKGTMAESKDHVIKLQTQLHMEETHMEEMQEALCSRKHLANMYSNQIAEVRKENAINEAQKGCMKEKIRLHQMRNLALGEEKDAAHRAKKDLENEVRKCRNEVEAVNRQRCRENDENQKLIRDRTALLDRVRVLEHETAEQTRQLNGGKRMLDQVQQQCIHSQHLLQRQAMRSKSRESSLRMQREICAMLKTSLANSSRNIKRKTIEANKFNGDRKRLNDVIGRMQMQMKNAEEKDELQTNQVQHLHKSLKMTSKQLRQQCKAMSSNLMHILQRDKIIGNVKDTNKDLQQELAISDLMGEQLKQQIDANEAEIIRKDLLLKNVGDERDRVKLQYQLIIHQITELKEHVQTLLVAEKQSQNAIKNADKTVCNQRVAIGGLLASRDVVSGKLGKRNEQVRFLSQKIELLEMTLCRGQAEYAQRLDDIALLKIEVKRLRQAEMQLRQSVHNLSQLKMEVFHLERDLTRERVKCKALEEEINNPLNLHRWRKLEGSDPDQFFLLRKTNFLQKYVMY